MSDLQSIMRERIMNVDVDTKEIERKYSKY